MFLPNTCFGKRPSEQAHLQCQHQALAFGHCPMGLNLEGLRFRAGIGDGHGQNVTTDGCR
jgi:hypothetical protein